MLSEQCASAFKNALWNFDEVSVLLSFQFNLCVIFFSLLFLYSVLKFLSLNFPVCAVVYSIIACPTRFQ